MDDTDRSLQKRVREAQLAQYNFIVVVGQEEMETKTLAIRAREGEQRNKISIANFMVELAQLVKEYK